MSLDTKKKISLLVVDDDDNFRELMQRYMQITPDIEVVGVASDGTEALEKMIALKPDIVTLDLVMPGVDGLCVLEKLSGLKLIKTPKIIVMSAMGMDSLVRKAITYGIDYYFVKPIEMSQIVNRIRMLFEQSKSGIKEQVNWCEISIEQGNAAFCDSMTSLKKTNVDLEVEVTTLLYEVGVPPHMIGYRCLKEAIIISVQSKNSFTSITKELYPAVARKLETTPQKVERAIRNSIEKAWLRSNQDSMDSLFGYSKNSAKSKPTNAEFIATLTERVRMIQKTL